MYQTDKVFIVARIFGYGLIIESAWTTKELAESARYYHAHDSMMAPEQFTIVERPLNQAKKV